MAVVPPKPDSNIVRVDSSLLNAVERPRRYAQQPLPRQAISKEPVALAPAVQVKTVTETAVIEPATVLMRDRKAERSVPPLDLDAARPKSPEVNARRVVKDAGSTTFSPLPVSSKPPEVTVTRDKWSDVPSPARRVQGSANTSPALFASRRVQEVIDETVKLPPSRTDIDSKVIVNSEPRYEFIVLGVIVLLIFRLCNNSCQKRTYAGSACPLNACTYCFGMN